MNESFKIIIYKIIIMLYIHYYYVKKFEDFSTFLANNNQSIFLKKIEKKSLIAEKILKLCQKVGEKNIAKVAKQFISIEV